MKTYYGKYAGKFEIVGVACRDRKAAWKKAVATHGLPWIHVQNEGSPDVSVQYGIEGYPTKILINPEGNIEKVVRGEDPAFYELLDKKFK